MMDLATHLHKSLAEIRALSSEELAYWMVRHRRKPLHNPYWGFAMVAHTTARVFGASGRLKVEDFMPKSQVRTHGKSLAQLLISRFKARPEANAKEQGHCGHRHKADRPQVEET